MLNLLEGYIWLRKTLKKVFVAGMMCVRKNLDEEIPSEAKLLGSKNNLTHLYKKCTIIVQ